MRVTVLYNQVGADAGPDERDVLVQVRHVASALGELGHDVAELPCTLDLEAARQRLVAARPDLVFNLVESLGGCDRLLYLAPALLEALAIPYTGSSAAALLWTTSKLLTKERLFAAGLPVPPVLAAWPDPGVALPAAAAPPARVILKSVWDHGSPALDDAAVIPAAPPEVLRARLRAVAPQLGGAAFAEPYVDGRELNLSLLAGPDGPDTPQVLPPAEIDFTAFPAGKPRIVGRDAKWEPGSFEYEHTPRRFDLPAEDTGLLAELAGLARAAWRQTGVAGYARVDFRVDGDGRPWILEVNSNPCLAPNAGFAAAAAVAGVSFVEVVARIVAAAVPAAEPSAVAPVLA